MSLKRISIISLAVAFFAFAGAFALTFEEYKQQQMQGFQKFKEERDREFSQYLKQQWSEFKGEPAEEQIKEPKPVVFPEADPKPKVDEDIQQGKPVEVKPVPKLVRPPEPEPVKLPPPVTVRPEPKAEPKAEPKVQDEPVFDEPVQKPAEKPVQAEKKGTKLEFSYFATPVTLRYDEALKVRLEGKPSSDTIAEYFTDLAVAEYPLTLKSLKDYRKSMSLNDWGYLTLIDKMAAEIAPSDTEKQLLTWFFLIKSGYDVRIGYKDMNVYLLVPSNVSLFGVSFFTFSSQKYYAINPEGPSGNIGSVYTYKKKYPNADNKLDFTVRTYPVLKPLLAKKSLKFKYDGKEYDVDVLVNKSTGAYFQYYPQSDVKVYATSEVPNWVSSTLLKRMREIIDGKSEKEAVNMILRFCQTAFDYKRDPEHFGREKFLFPEETLIYRYSDCEDRSILFSYMVRALVGLDVVLLDYPGHIATAVKFNEKVSGANLNIGGDKYTICDPTFINANIGREMAEFKNTTPKVIRF